MACVVWGAASSGGAEVDPSGPPGPAVWGASCVGPGPSELVVYGRGWAAGPVGLKVTDQTGAVVGSASPGAADRSGGAAFQVRVPLTPRQGAPQLHVAASQLPGRAASHDLVVSPSCSPSISAVINATPCAAPGRPVSIAISGRGAPTSDFSALVHYIDLYGPAELVDRSEPQRPAGDYNLTFGVPNVPGRVVPVTLEGRRANGFAYATANVTLPPACAPPTSVTTPPGGPTTSGPATTGPAGATTAPPTSTGPPAPGPTTPFQFRPSTGMSLELSPALGRAGEATTVAGRGFAPSQAVTLRWRPGIGTWSVTAGGDGSFRTQVLVLPNDVEGPRVLEVVGGGVNPAGYLVVPSSEQPAFGGLFVRS